MRYVAIGLTALVTVSMLAACGDDDDDTVANVQEANTAFCQDLSAYGTALAGFGDLDPATATKADYDAAADTVKSARSDLSESASDLVEAEVANLAAQAEDLDGAFADAPDDAVVADIVSAAQVQVTEVRASVAAVNTAVCTAENAATTTQP